MLPGPHSHLPRPAGAWITSVCSGGFREAREAESVRGFFECSSHGALPARNRTYTLIVANCQTAQAVDWHSAAC